MVLYLVLEDGEEAAARSPKILAVAMNLPFIYSPPPSPKTIIKHATIAAA
jgi:hypothetical protein